MKHSAIWLLAFTALPVLAAAPFRKDSKPEDSWEDEVREQVYQSIPAEDEKGFQRLREPMLGDWLSYYYEFPQTIEKYRLTTRVRPTEERRTIVLQPLGNLDAGKKKVLETMREYAEVFFQLPARIESSIALDLPGKTMYRNVPLGNRHGTYDRQYDGGQIMKNLLIKRMPKDAALYLGITMADLFDGETNFVFGVGNLEKRVGVYSLCRFYPEFWGIERSAGDDVKGLRRACKLLNHESGHMFGITHCVFYNCSMNGSNSLTETDSHPAHYCPVCHRKLLWNIGFDAQKRFDGLREFYARHALNEEAAWITSRADRWKKLEESESLKKVRDE